ncbi:Hemoglobin-like flavoprotein [Pseudonocardia thermophila]|uniref:Hemoglobin-like flavoprotein n=1 Tax=Pseudonocardia thermophila TaxID=1848 RepID=A0A1M6N4F0_PSETH|nr:globin domain-containing protein [Pseudonocardia thermophila]SHJ90557.1 Hemoglobin-like flavoprotein [Pseudonocardia thermophila]
MTGMLPPRPAPDAIAAVRQSLQAVVDRPLELAEVFYEELFAMEPRLRAVFPHDLSGQMYKMTEMLLAAITGLTEPDLSQLEARLHELGRRHFFRYGVEPWQYTYIGHALVRAVREVAGPAFSGAMSSSWIALAQWVTAHMIAGAENARLAGPEAAGPAPVAEERPQYPVPAQAPRPVEPLPQPRGPHDTRFAPNY